MSSLKNIAILIIQPLMLLSCIEVYTPDIEADESNKYVVFGQLTTEQEDHIISVAIASTIQEPNLLPLNDCTVKIVDTDGNLFEGNEFEGGIYKVRIPLEYLITGVKYQLEIITPAGKNLVSEYEELLKSPDIDSVFFVRESKPTNDPEIFIEGIQFYLNLDAPDFENVYYKFDVIETWEYHSMFPLVWFYDGILHNVDPPDYSNNVCWTTEHIRNIFILNTAELQNNAYKQYSLHFVDNTSQRLEYLYSLLLRQYTISEQAYVFWDQLQANNIEQGGLYETQPLPAKGNLINLTNPEQSVLGYFQVSSVKTKRIFVKDVPDLELSYEPNCGFWLIARGLQFYDPFLYPIYLTPSFMECVPECIFCELSGGTMTRPAFWPNQ